MKKIIIIFYAFIAIVNISMAQPPPCPYDCPEVPWQGAFYIACPVCAGVTASCYYEYRNNTCVLPNKCQFRIVSNITINGPFSPLCDMGTILRNLSTCIISQKIGDCNPNDVIPVEFFTAACWKWDGDLPEPGGPMPNIISCFGAGCCISVYQVIKLYDNKGNFTGYQINYSYSYPYGPNTCDPNDHGCTYLCE